MLELRQGERSEMSGLLLDTHSAIWFALADERLSDTAREAITREFVEGRAPAISVISMVEIVYLVEKRRVPESTFSIMIDLNRAGRLAILPVDMGVVGALAALDRRAIPDMPDRIIAATALCFGVSLVTRDERIRRSFANVVW